METAKPVRLFDSNVLVGPLAERPPGAPEDVSSLIAMMAHYGLEQALVTHTIAKWHDPMTGNRRLMGELAGQPRLVGCWAVLPAATGEAPPEPEQVAQLLASGARAARLCPPAHKVRLEPWVVDPLLGALAERRVPVFLDFDTRHWSEELPWAAIERIGRTYPTLPVVLLRQGHADLRTLYPLLDRCPNVHVETSYLEGHEVIRRMVERWGADRLLFGSGMPIWDPGLAITGLTYSGLRPDDRKAVAGGTLRNLIEGCVL